MGIGLFLYPQAILKLYCPRSLDQRARQRLPTTLTIGLNKYKILKKMLEQAKYIFDTFEYFWDDHKSKFL